MKKRAADRACRDRVLARPEPGGRWQRQLGVREGEHQGFFECTLRKADAKGDYSLSEDDKNESEEFPEFLDRG